MWIMCIWLLQTYTSYILYIYISARGSPHKIHWKIHWILPGHQPQRDGVGLLVMSPTRELAQQIEVPGMGGSRTGVVPTSVVSHGFSSIFPQKYTKNDHSMILSSSRRSTFLQMHCQALSFSLLRPTTWNLQLWDMTNNAKQRAVDLRVKAGWPWVSRWKQIALANAWACSMPLVLQMSNDTKECRFRGCGCSHCRHVICRMNQIPVHKTIKTSKDIKRI